MGELILVPLRCTECASARDVALCRVCQKPVCPRHRAGLGSLDEGYTCTGQCLLSDFGGFVQNQSSGVQTRPPLERGEGSLVILALVGIVAVLTLIVIYLIVEKPWLFG